jgi:hypothetical protein
MALSENFRAEPLTDNFWRSNRSIFHLLTAANGCAPIMLRILKFGKRTILKGPRTKEEEFFHAF